jgi:hypothetical protein
MTKICSTDGVAVARAAVREVLYSSTGEEVAGREEARVQ